MNLRRGGRQGIVNPRDYRPPDGWETFSIRLYGRANARQQQSTINKLTDAQLSWLARVAARELEHRANRQKGA